MSESTLQPVEGAGILDALANLFFKGMDKALSERAEYEEEMGVLKQINRIPIETLDGKNTYTLIVKLSPIRGKDNYYYVEAETDAPGLDVSGLHQKTLKLDNTNMRQFRNTIDKLISNSNYAADMDRSDEANADTGEVVGKPAEGEENNSSEGEIISESEVKELIDEAQSEFDGRAIGVTDPDGLSVQLTPEYKNVTSDECQIDIVAKDENNSVVNKYSQVDDNVVSLRNDSGELVSIDDLLDTTGEILDEFIEINKFTGIHTVGASTIVSATFIKDSEGIGLTAIKASDDLNKTMTIVYDIMDSDEFVNSLQDGEESSFTIEETADDYDIQPTDSVDCTQCYADAYKVVSKLYITLKLLESMIGIKIWQSDNFFSDLTGAVVDLQTKVSIWALNNSDMLPILQDPFTLVPTFEKFRNYSDNSQIPEIKNAICEEAVLTIQLCNFLSVDFDDEKQIEMEEMCKCIEGILNTK